MIRLSIQCLTLVNRLLSRFTTHSREQIPMDIPDLIKLWIDLFVTEQRLFRRKKSLFRLEHDCFPKWTNEYEMFVCGVDTHWNKCLATARFELLHATDKANRNEVNNMMPACLPAWQREKTSLCIEIVHNNSCVHSVHTHVHNSFYGLDRPYREPMRTLQALSDHKYTNLIGKNVNI